MSDRHSMHWHWLGSTCLFVNFKLKIWRQTSQFLFLCLISVLVYVLFYNSENKTKIWLSQSLSWFLQVQGQHRPDHQDWVNRIKRCLGWSLVIFLLSHHTIFTLHSLSRQFIWSSSPFLGRFPVNNYSPLGLSYYYRWMLVLARGYKNHSITQNIHIGAGALQSVEVMEEVASDSGGNSLDLYNDLYKGSYLFVINILSLIFASLPKLGPS